MRVCVVSGDRWHPADTVKAGLNALDSAVSQWEFIDEETPWSEERMNAAHVTVLAKMNRRSPHDERPWLTPDVQQAFVNYVEKGGGLLIVHAGTVGYREEAVFKHLAGGVFTHHPEPCPVTLRPIHTAQHPIPAPFPDTAPFVMQDEHYFVELEEDPQLKVLLTSTSVHGEQPAGWIRQQGKGRVCVLTPGHFEEVRLHPLYQEWVAAALRWYAGA